jgi:hypothetical protein
MDAVVLVELVLLLEESIGVGWRWCFLLLAAVVLVERVLLLERRASALVGGGDRCWVKAVALVEPVLLLEESIGVG